MHSHDRTLMAKLGFSDPDRGTPDHDLACLYMASKGVCEQVAALLARFAPAGLKESPDKVVVSATPEFHLRKGEGQYSTTIGFVDVLYRVHIMGPEFSYREQDGVDQSSPDWREWKPRYVTRTGRRYLARYPLACEVKISSPPIGDLLRQMRVYTDYLRLANPYAYEPNGFPLGLVVTRHPLPAAEKAALVEAGIRPVTLSDNYKTYSGAAVPDERL